VVPPEVKRLFWDVDASAIDLDRDRDYVLGRVMARGGMTAMRWLVATFSSAVIGDFVVRRGDQLAPRERAFWALIGGVDVEVGPGGGRPTWAG
jgi:hypothetical protein